MTRRVLIAIGTALLTIGGSGIIIALVWITVDKLHGTLPSIYDSHAQAVLFLFPVLLLSLAIAGAALVSSALSIPSRGRRTERNLHGHTHSHA